MCRLPRQFRARRARNFHTEPMIFHSSIRRGSETQSTPCLIGAKLLRFRVLVDGDIRSLVIREGYLTDKTAATRSELECEQIDVTSTISEEMRVTTLESTNSEVRDYD
jgi:hypothetical protein